MSEEIRIGSIVEFFPGIRTQYELPHKMKSVIGIVTQINGETVNLFLFACSNDRILTAWNIEHKSTAKEGWYYWDWIK